MNNRHDKYLVVDNTVDQMKREFFQRTTAMLIAISANSLDA
jgi:hypothetical protein